jgi:phenylacetate-CoA ligase
MPRGMIGGRRIILDPNSKGPFHRYNFAEKQIYFSAYHISPRNTKKYAEALKKRPVSYMTGYAVSNFTLAKFLLDQKIDVPPLKAVITSSEKLTPEMRQVFQKVYGCKTYDSYSGVEACGLISENEFGQLLISPDVGIMEVLKEDGTPCQPGEIGEIYSTGFLNYDQPLIRYRIGDMVKLAKDQKTKCGRNMVVVEEIIGRVEDTVIGADGRQMVRFHGIFMDLPKIIEGQIIQHKLGKFEIKVVASEALTQKEQETMKSRMISQLGDIELTINEVQLIERNSNGKFKAVVSHIKGA